MTNNKQERIERSFGQYVRGLRTTRGMTQEVLAERCDLSIDSIRRLESGSFSPSLETLRKLGVGLDLMLSTLFESFEHGDRDLTRELVDLIANRSPGQIMAVTRVARALLDELDDLRDDDVRARAQPDHGVRPSADRLPDLADVRGLALPRQALEIALAGGHNLLLHGPPGVGKTMLAWRIAGLLPPLQLDEMVEVSTISRLGRDTKTMDIPPVRAPHYTTSPAAMFGGGGGQLPKPGEVSLAHRGVLVLDDLTRFSSIVLERLREPLGKGLISLGRARSSNTYPAGFQLIATMRRCPCGFLGDPENKCTDSQDAIREHQARVLPLLEFFDLVVPVSPITAEERASPASGEPSGVVRERVIAARDRQRRRLADTQWTRNAELPTDGEELDRLCGLTPDASMVLNAPDVDPLLGHRLRRVARTIEDLAPGRKPKALIDAKAMAVAIELRPDRPFD